MDSSSGTWVATLAALGLIAGLFLLWRGLRDYRSLVRVADTSTSNVSSIAAGEVRISGVIAPAEMTLVSLLQSRACVYYRATVGDNGDARTPDAGYTEERSIGFQVRDSTGTIRVFPRGGRFDAPVRFEGETGISGDEPTGLDIRQSGSTALSPSDLDIAAQTAALLTVKDPDDGWTLRPGLRDRRGRQTYRETRLEPGDAVTVVGRALPFSDLDDPAGADLGTGSDPLLDDPEVAADIEAARASGSLADDPDAAWGNAAIPGFGIGRPVETPVLDPAARPMPLAGPEEAARVVRTFEIAPETLVIAASDEVQLLVAYGIPGDVVQRNQTRFLVGLFGAMLAIASAMVLAVGLSGGIGP